VTSVANLAPSADDPRPVEPEPLPEGACCDSGCDPCVQDTWRADWLAWKAALKAWEGRQGARVIPIQAEPPPAA
jgi:Oxidoreductase-like protein, N-terminal